MFVLAGLGLGGIYGAILAKRRGGKKLDSLQYAAGFGIAFGLLGLIITIALARILSA